MTAKPFLNFHTKLLYIHAYLPVVFLVQAARLVIIALSP